MAKLNLIGRIARETKGSIAGTLPDAGHTLTGTCTTTGGQVASCSTQARATGKRCRSACS